MPTRQSHSDIGIASVILLLALSLTPIVFGIGWGIRHRSDVDPDTISPVAGFAYTVPVPASEHRMLEVLGDTPEHARRAATQLLENGRRLGPPHRPHVYIQGNGSGQFSHWISDLYFSTSDNSDPRTNKRRYTIVTAATVPLVAFVAWAAAVTLLSVIGRWLPGGVRELLLWSPPAVWRALGVLAAGGTYLTLIHVSLDPLSLGSSRPQALRVLWGSSVLLSALLGFLAGLALSGLDRRSLARAQTRLTSVLVHVGRPFEGPGWRGLAWRSLSLGIPVAVFASFLWLSFTPQILFASYSSFLPVALSAAILLWCCHVRRGWLSTLAGLTVTLALFALPLAALWQNIGTHFSSVGGLLPFADASGYYYDARRLGDGQLLGWSARRPLFVGLLATLLAVTGRNLQIVVACFVALNGFASFLLAREVRCSHGPLAAVLVTLVLFLFYRMEGGAGTTLTENLGLAMGSIAFAVLWCAIGQRGASATWIGLGLLTLALMARAGAFFVLPAIVIAGMWMHRRERWGMLFASGSAAATLLAIALTLGLGRVLRNPAASQTALSNFSYTLYGLVVGGKGWGQVTIDYPNAREGAEIYGLAFRAFRANPIGLVQGSLNMWRVYLVPQGLYHVFGFVRDAWHPHLFQLGCYVLSAAGLVSAIRRPDRPQHVLLVAAVIGHFASIPFVPPIDAGLRVYAATMPVLAILVGVGAAGVTAAIKRLIPSAAPDRAIQENATSHVVRWPSPAVVGVTLALVLVVGPLAVYMTGRAPSVTDVVCAADQRPAYVRFDPGSSLRIIGDTPDVDDTRVIVPDVRQGALRATAGVVEINQDIDRFTAGHTMINGYDLKTGRFIWLVAPTRLLPPPPAVLRICGHESTDPVSRNYGVFFAESVQDLADPSRQ